MSKTDHIAKAKDYMAKGDEFYAKAGAEIAAWLEEDFSRTHQQAADLMGVSRKTIGRLYQMHTSGSRAPEWDSGTNVRTEVAEKALKDPEQRRQVIASMPTSALDALQQEATEAVVQRARAERSEHRDDTVPTVRQIEDGDRFNPSEAWADTLIIRANRNLRELSKHVDRFGFVLGSMDREEAFSYMQDTERLAAEVRAAVQEQIRDSVGA